MLYEFYTKQNAKKPKSIHATYLLTGTKREEEEEHTNGANGQDGDDTVMRSSPYMSSMPEPDEDEEEDKPVPTTTIEVVRDEELEGMQGRYWPAEDTAYRRPQIPRKHTKALRPYTYTAWSLALSR